MAICLGRIWQNFDSARWCGVRDSAHEKLYSLLSDPIPEVRLSPGSGPGRGAPQEGAPWGQRPQRGLLSCASRVQKPSPTACPLNLSPSPPPAPPARDSRVPCCPCPAPLRPHKQGWCGGQGCDPSLRQVRCAAVFALGTFVGNSAERTDHSTTIDHNVAMMLAQLISDGSPMVRKVRGRAWPRP